jgi:microcin C transport system permease protein
MNHAPNLFRQRLAVFRRNRRARISLWLFALLFGISLFAEFIANDRPIVMAYQGQLYWPVFHNYIEQELLDGGAFESAVDYTDPWVQREIDAHGWMVWPLIRFHHQTIHYNVPRAPSAPDSINWLGTDDQSRDVLARVIYGFRLSILFALTLTFFASIIGITLGAIQGYFGGMTDLLLQRFIEIWQGMPVLYLLIILASIVEPNFWWLLGLMLLFSWMALVDLVRAEFLRARNFDYVRAARALGVSQPMIMWRHVLPNAMVSTLTFVPFILGGAVTMLTSLDFLGFGLPAGSPSLGELLAQGKNNPQAVWLGLTGFAVLAVMLSLLIFIGEGVRDAFNPRKIFARRS